VTRGPLEWARAETGGADRWVLWRRGFSGVARVNKVTPVSLGYQLSVFNKNFILKGTGLAGKKKVVFYYTRVR